MVEQSKLNFVAVWLALCNAFVKREHGYALYAFASCWLLLIPTMAKVHSRLQNSCYTGGLQTPPGGARPMWCVRQQDGWPESSCLKEGAASLAKQLQYSDTLLAREKPRASCCLRGAATLNGLLQYSML